MPDLPTHRARPLLRAAVVRQRRLERRARSPSAPARRAPTDHALPWPAVTVSLQAPPPLDVPLPRRRATDDGGVVATYDGRPVLSARCSHDRGHRRRAGPSRRGRARRWRRTPA